MSTGTVRKEIDRRTYWRLEVMVNGRWCVASHDKYDDPARPYGIIKSMNDTRKNYRVVEETTIRTVIEEQP